MENWNPVVGYEGYYEVSDLGRVRSVERIVKSSSRNGGERRRPSKILKPNQKRNGYLSVDLCKEGKITTISVHRLVARAFLGDKPEMQVNHINAIKTDNRAANLEWCTPSENLEHIRRLKDISNGYRKRLRCVETGEVFESSYKAAEWVNAHTKQFSGNIPSMSRSIRGCATGRQRIAFGYHWEDVK